MFLAGGDDVGRTVPARCEALWGLVRRFESPTRRRSRAELGAHGETEDVRYSNVRSLRAEELSDTVMHSTNARFEPGGIDEGR